MKPVIGKTYIFLPTTKDVWDVIRETYSDAENTSQIFELKMRFWQMKQGDLEVMEYYTEMLGLWQDLDLNCEEEWECTGDSVRFKKKMENEIDNSPLHLTIEKLNSKNYREWAQAIKLVIDGKGKLGLLTGETWRPPRIDVTASQKWWSEKSFITSCLNLHEASHWQNLYLPADNKGCVGCDTRNIFRCREYFPNL